MSENLLDLSLPLTYPNGNLGPTYSSLFNQLVNTLGNKLNTASFGNSTIKALGDLALTGDYIAFKNILFPAIPDLDYIDTPVMLYIADTSDYGWESTKTTLDDYVAGEIIFVTSNTIPAGWLALSSGTIGATGSPASVLADDSTYYLYQTLWTQVSDTYCPVLPSRGASWEFDFILGKPITLPKVNGRAIGIAGSGSGLTARAIGEIAGTETETISITNMPSHSHNYGVSVAPQVAPDLGGSNTVSAITGTTVANSDNNGNGDSHNNMQPSTFFQGIIKL